MVIDLIRGHSKIISCALDVPESHRPLWFNNLRGYIRANVERIPDISWFDLIDILELIDQTEKALK